MKKLSLAICSLLILFISCSEDTTVDLKTTTADFTVQHNEWKTATISNDIITNQKNISHYEFDVAELQALIDDQYVIKVWFDIGLTLDNRISFTATGESKFGKMIGEVTSQAISQQKSKADFSIFDRTKNIEFDIASEQSHILPHQNAYKYLTSMESAYADFESLLLHDGERVERFGLNSGIVQRMLNTKDISSLALFLGQNDKNKITTVFIGKDKLNNLLIDSSSDIATAGRAFDFTRPCPGDCLPCSNSEAVCAQQCSIFGWEYCCVYTCPPGGGDL